MSAQVVSSAARTGWMKGSSRMNVPIRMRLVRVAIAEAVAIMAGL